MFSFLRLLYLVFFLTKVTSSSSLSLASNSSGCVIALSELPATQPLFLTSASPPSSSSNDLLSTYKLFKPSGNHTILDVGTKLRLYCPGKSNTIQLLQKNAIELFCRSNNILEAVDGEVYSLKDLSCKTMPIADLKLTSTMCGGLNSNGYIYEAGFNINTTYDFLRIFKICYNNATEDTLYTHHILNGAAIKFALPENTRRGFRANGMKFSTTAVNKFYTINNQIQRFNEYFGEHQNYIDRRMFFARGHLTPDADFIFAYEQLSTYFYVNVAPQFQIINSGNWVRVENLARNLAAEFNGDLEIYNGYMGQLQLLHPQTGDVVDVFLEDSNQIEVPEFYFKVIKHEPSNAAIVMITINNPFISEPDQKEFCTNVCARAGLHNKYFTDESRGYTFCCELKEFKKYYTNLPKKLTAKRLLVKALPTSM